MSTVLQEPEPMVDVNMARLVERLYGPRTLADIRYDPHINGIARRLIALAAHPTEFNWAVLDLGAAHCKARSPSCSDCPLLEICPFGQRRAANG
jgi:A/G-specific adenine glycosylase